MAGESLPDVVALDVVPWSSGWTALAARKGDDEPAGIPTILLATHDQTGLLLGDADFLPWPAGPEQLRAALGRHRHEAGIGGLTHHLLVIAADDAARAWLRGVAAEEGWSAAEAGNTKSGLVAVAERRPDVVFLELLLPGMDSLRLLRELRKAAAWLSIAVVLMAPQDLADAEGERLQQPLQQLLAQGSLRSEALLEEVRDSLQAVPYGGAAGV